MFFALYFVFGVLIALWNLVDGLDRGGSDFVTTVMRLSMFVFDVFFGPVRVVLKLIFC